MSEANGAPDPAELQRVREEFSEKLPAVTRLARLQHRSLRGAVLEDAVQETVARAWHSYLKTALEGEDPAPLLNAMVRYAAKHVRSGKLLGRSEPRRDALSRLARAEGGFEVTRLPAGGLRQRGADPAEEAACNVDYQEWLAGLTGKQREVAEALAAGFNPSEVARQRGVSKASVQQIRDKLALKWEEFHGGGEGRGR